MTESTTSQRKSLYRLFGYCKETEALHVKAITGLYAEAKQLTEEQADKLIKSLSADWAKFDKFNQAHKYILSLLRQLEWVKTHDKYGTVADMPRLSNFLKSKNSPLHPDLKPLQNMNDNETSKLIVCLESMLIKKSSKCKQHF